MPQTGKTYHLIAELLSTLQAEGYPLGTGQQLQVQELLNKLPEETTLEELPFLLAPLFAHNPKEQARFYELFEQCRKRTEAYYQDIEREELVAPDRQERRFRGLIWVLALLLLVPPAIVAYQFMQPEERSFIEKPFQVQAGGQATVCLSDSTDLQDFGTPESYEVLYSGKGGLGSFLIDTPQCLVYIAQDSIEGRDSVVVRWTNGQGQHLVAIYQALIQQTRLEPETDTIPVDSSVTVDPPLAPPTFELKTYPFNHDPLAFAVQQPPWWREFIANNFWWLKWVGLLLFTALLLAILFYRAYRRRKLVAELESKDKPPYAWNIQIGGAEAIHLGDDFGYLLNLIRQRTGSEAFKLDVPKTIGATIEQGGMPTFRFLQQTKPPEYLLLIDQQSPRNHRARLLDLLFQVFHANEVLIERFFFDNDPRICYNEAFPEGIPLSEVQRRYASSRLIVVSYGNALLHKLTGKLAPWSQLLSNWKHRLLLTPRPTLSWGKRERRLGALFTVLPLSMQSLAFWLEELEMEEDARFDTWLNRVKDAPKTPIELNGALAPSLRPQLGEPLLKWIAACAVYPSLHWDLTLYLGQQLSTKTTNLLTVDNLLQLTRLAWFTEGRIPPATRMSLITWLEAEHPALLEQVRVQLADVLQQNPPPSDSAAFEDYRMNIALNEWLTVKDKQRKKALQQEIGHLMEAGADVDITVIKQLQRERHPLDFILSDNLKKYFRPHGLPGLGWRGEWRDVLRWGLFLWIPALLLTAYPWSIQPADCEGVLVDYQVGEAKELLCINSLDAIGVMVEAQAKAAIQTDSLPNASAFNAQAMLWQIVADVPLYVSAQKSSYDASWQWRMPPSGNSTIARLITYNAADKTLALSRTAGGERYRFPDGWAAEYRSNMAIAFYNKGAELYQRGSEFFDLSPEERQAQLREAFEEWKKIKAGTSTLPPDVQQSMLNTLERLGVRDTTQLQSGEVSEATLQYGLEQLLTTGKERVCAYFQEAILLDSTQLDMDRIRKWCLGGAVADTIPQEACYVISNVPNEVALRSRVLSRSEANELNANYGKPGWDKLRVNRQTLVKSIRPGEQVQLLEEGPDYYRIRHKNVEGYIVKTYKDQPLLSSCSDSTAESPEPTPPATEKKPPARVPGKDLKVVTKPSELPPIERQPGKGTPEPLNPAIQQTTPKAHTPRYLWCLDNPHGNDTPGKRSPVFDDGKTQLFEYALSRDVVNRIIRRLEEAGVAYYRVVTEEEDISLQERARRINNYNTRLPKLTVSVHFNTGIPEVGGRGEIDWAGASTKGVEAWFYSQSPVGERLGAIFLEKIIQKTGLLNRYLKSKEGQMEFYLLRQANNPATLIENGFLNNRADAALLAQPAFRQRLADAYVEAILAIEGYGLEKTPAPLIEEKDSDGDGVTNSEDGCPFTPGPADNKGCPEEEPKTNKAPSKEQGKLDEFPKKGQSTLGGKAYRTIQFEANGPVWMAQNLDYEVVNSWCYNGRAGNCEQYGRLYTWPASQEACKQLGDGWRMPTDEEWSALREKFGGDKNAYTALKDTESTSFNAILGGYRTPKGSFDDLEVYGSYWSGTPLVKERAYYYYFSTRSRELRRAYEDQLFGYSCRCVKD